MSNITQYTSETNHRYDMIAVGFCIITLIFALYIGHFHKIGNFGVETDFYGAYAKQAENILEGRPYTYQHNPPGYMLLLAAVSLFTSDYFVAAKIITAFATALFGWIIYLLFKSLFDHRIALVSTILSILAIIPYSFNAATDIFGALLIILPIWIFLRQSVHTFKMCFLAGVLAGVAYLVRYNAIFVIIGIVFSILFINLYQETIRRRLVRVGLFVCGALLISSPWLIINWIANGSPFASTAYAQIAGHFFHPAGGLFPMQKAFKFNSILDVVLYDPSMFLWKYLKDVLFWNLVNLTKKGLVFPANLFAGAGILFLIRNLNRRRIAFLVVCFIGYLMLGLVGFGFRYYFFLIPLLYLLPPYFLFQRHVFNMLGYIHFSKIPISWLIVIIISVFLSMSSYGKIRSNFASEPRHVFDIADLLRSRSSPRDGDIIIELKQHYSYYSGLKGAFPMAQTPDGYRNETANDYIVKARRIGARYIIYSDREARSWPSLKSFSDPKTVPNSLRLIYHHKPTNTLIYEIDIRAKDNQ